jgi:hypothetical protein
MKKLLTLITILLFGFSSSVVNAQTATKKATATHATTHTKKDGTPDKRYKENKTTTTTTGPAKI